MLTLIAELSGALLLGIRDKKDLLLIAIVNIVTNPPLVLILNIVYIYYREYFNVIWVVALELLAWWGEGIIYKQYLQFRSKNPFALSLLLNGLSYFGGLILS